MRILITFILLGILSFNAVAQEINYDKKTGLVLVNGKEAFYFTSVGKVFDPAYKLENLDHKELAFYKTFKIGEKYNSFSKKMESDFVYRVTFSYSNSLNTCDVDANQVKYILKDIVNYGLVKNGEIDPSAEERYVLGNGGQLQRNNEPSKVVVNVGSQEATPPANLASPTVAIVFEDISVENDQIYKKDKLAGSYKINTTDGITTVTVYDAADNKVAIASHNDNSDTDWNTMIVETNQRMEIRYYAQSTLNKLFFSLIQKNILK